MKVQERFLQYISCWTTSCEEADTVPSTQCQFQLAHILEQELLELGLSQVRCDEHCYVYGLLPATPGYEQKKSLGFIAHIDTSPAYPGDAIHPQLITDYNGEDVTLSATGDVLKISDFPQLAQRKGQTLIVTDGTTLLGADDKAGIAEILTALEQLIQQKLPHGDIWVGFTPDEEIGMGSSHFDLNYFKADYAYTVDGDYEGEIAYENFNAASAVFQIKGVNVHPGSAKDIMVNAGSVACELQSLLPPMEVPEHTEDREGFFHLDQIFGDVASAQLHYIIRDHDKDLFAQRQELLQRLTDQLNRKYGPGTVTLTITESYRNMLEIMEQHAPVIERAREAIQAVGLTPLSRPVRGGTDGAQLSFRGLPCPNLGTGGDGFHGPFEHITVEGMETVVKILLHIAQNPMD